MLRRLTLVSLLVFQSFWLAVVLPGHTRGAVTLPGYKPTAADDGGGCCGCPVDKDRPHAPPDPARAAHCAVCFFAARLTVPVVIDLTPKPLELAFIQPPPRSEQTIALDFLPAYFGRAPPVG